MKTGRRTRLAVSVTFYTHGFSITIIIQLGGLNSNSLNLNHRNQSKGQRAQTSLTENSANKKANIHKLKCNLQHSVVHLTGGIKYLCKQPILHKETTGMFAAMRKLLQKTQDR